MEYYAKREMNNVVLLTLLQVQVGGAEESSSN